MTELKQAEEAIRRSHAAYQELVNWIDGIVWEIDVRTFTYLFVSQHAERLLGYPVERWLTEPTFFQDHLHPDDREWAIAFCLQATREKRDHEMEYRMIAVDGRTVWLRDLVSVIVENDQPVKLRGVMVDITERKRTDEARAERTRLTALRADISDRLAQSVTLRSILQHCTEAIVQHLDVAFARIWTLNETENVLELQASAGMYTHIDGAHSRVTVGQLKIGRIAQKCQPHLTNTVPDDSEISDREWAKLEGMVAFAGYPLMIEGRAVGVVAMFARQPLAENVLTKLAFVVEGMGQCIRRKWAEEALQKMNQTLEEQVRERTVALLAKQQQLQSLAAELSRTEERERKRLAAELHDNLAQMLALCNMKFGAVKADLTEGRSSKTMNEIQGVLDEELTYTRTLMSDLRPPLLGDEHDLPSAVSWVIQKMQRYGLLVTVKDDRQQKVLDDEVLTVTYRSIQELLFNVLKHARIKKATVSLQRSGEFLEAVVRDQGVGFEVAASRVSSKEDAFGLLNIRERLELLGGRLEIISVLGEGTCAKIIVPLKAGTYPTGSRDQQQDSRSPNGTTGGPLLAQGAGSKIRVLLVDDNRIMRE